MQTPHPFSLRIFVADGDPDGLRLVDRTNWIGKGVVFPRALFPRIKARDEFKQTGVYFLLGPRDDGEGEMLYVGEGDPVGPRLLSHFGEKDFWTRAVFFVAPGFLNKAHVQYLEAKLVQLARETKRMQLDNGTAPTEPSLSEADRADMDVFLGNLLGLLPVLGIHAFEKGAPAISGHGKTNSPEILTCKGKGVTASGYETTQGFLVRAGSEAVAEANEMPSLSAHLQAVYSGRRDLIHRGVLRSEGIRLIFTQDYTFTSPSLAAAIVLGRSVNGRIEWKTSKGLTLRQLQELTAPIQL